MTPPFPCCARWSRNSARIGPLWSFTTSRIGPNGKVNNLLGGLAQARHDVLVISDSGCRELRPDYLSAIVAPLADPKVGAVNTLFKTVQAERWFERMELLTLNADFIPSVIFRRGDGGSGLLPRPVDRHSPRNA